MKTSFELQASIFIVSDNGVCDNI